MGCFVVFVRIVNGEYEVLLQRRGEHMNLAHQWGLPGG